LFGVLEYCATLQSAVELRETFSAYLGSTPQVSQFATEFLKRKEASGGAPVGVPATGSDKAAAGKGAKKK
jgi:hypothetical protein